MRPLFAIAPLAFLLALFSPSTAEVTASFESFQAMFASGKKASADGLKANASPTLDPLDR